MEEVSYLEKDVEGPEEDRYDCNRDLALSVWKVMSTNFSERLSQSIKWVSFYFDTLLGAWDKVLKEAHTAQRLLDLNTAILESCDSQTEFSVHVGSSRQCMESKYTEDDLKDHTTDE